MSGPLQILIYSETTAATVSGNLGRAEYSYYFILEKYLPLLCRLGEVVYVREPLAEVDRLSEEARRAGRRAVFLSFTPPHRTARGLHCPTVCVLAWEFDNIPAESWDPDQPWHNWVEAIRQIGNVITISEFATRVIRRQVGRGPRVVTIPAPVVRDLTGPDVVEAPTGRHPQSRAGRSVTLAATIIDTRELEISADSVTRRVSGPDVSRQQVPWDGSPLELHFTTRGMSSDLYLVGFYVEEEWGCWSRTLRPSIILPWSVSGRFTLTLELVGFGANQGRELDITLGDQVQRVVLPASLQPCDFEFRLDRAVDTIYLSGITPVSAPGARDHRTLGVGISRLVLRRSDEPGQPGPRAWSPPPATAAETPTTLELPGPVYASVFNPADGRKNWHDMVTAFCWAFRDDPGKTLVLKMSHHNRSAFLGDLLLLFSRLWPFRCRVVAIHGYLSADELQQLVAATDFFVNASVAEGQCLPLLEFMADGVPGLSPAHTAMETYVNRDDAFVVHSSPQPYTWPQDPRRAYRTRAYRISWDSLRQAFVDSAALLAEGGDGYAAMSRAAAMEVRRHYAERRIEGELKTFLDRVAGRGRWRWPTRG